MESGNIPDDWTPSPPPPIGSPEWKDQIAFDVAMELNLLDKTGVYEMPTCHLFKLGYFVVRKTLGGTDYFRVDDIVTLDALRATATTD